MKNKIILLFISVGILLILFSLFFSSSNVNTFFSKTIAQVKQKNGYASIESADQVNPLSLEVKSKITHLNTIKTEARSEVVITLDQFKADIKIFENSQILFENNEENIILTIKVGQLEIESLGNVDVNIESKQKSDRKENAKSFWIKKEGRQYSAIDYYSSIQNQNENNTKKDILTKNYQNQSGFASKEQLSQIKIEELLNSKKNEFFRCYGQLIQKDEPSHGQVLISFEVQNSGKTNQVTISKTDIQQPVFLSCLKEIIQRTQFPSFSGPAITTVFPLSFE